VNKKVDGRFRPAAKLELVFTVEVTCYDGVVKSVQKGGEISW